MIASQKRLAKEKADLEAARAENDRLMKV